MTQRKTWVRAGSDPNAIGSHSFRAAGREGKGRERAGVPFWWSGGDGPSSTGEGPGERRRRSASRRRQERNRDRSG
jgi:hypothetical protein